MVRIVVVGSSLEPLPLPLPTPLPLPLTSKRRTVVYSSEVINSEEVSADEEAVTPGAGIGGRVV